MSPEELWGMPLSEVKQRWLDFGKDWHKRPLVVSPWDYETLEQAGIIEDGHLNVAKLREAAGL